MGFGNVVSQVVLFMALLISIMVLSLVYKSYVSTTNVSLENQHNQIIKKIDTSFLIEQINYDVLENQIEIEVINNGAIKLDTNYVDIFLNNNKILRNERLIKIDDLTNLINPYYLDPGEKMLITANIDLKEGAHLIVVGVENSVTRSAILQVL